MLKELEDYTWFPPILRRWQMDFIGSLAVWTKLYAPLAPVLQELITETPCIKIQDVCSGSGLPALYIQKRVKNKLPLFLSDKFPGESFNKTDAKYITPSVDVTTLQPLKNTCYTMYNAFHHFNAVTQLHIVKSMAAANVPFLFAEILQPGIFNMIKIFLTTTVVQLLAAPFVKPFSLARLFFTYIVPVNIFTITYDGVVSVLKSKTAGQFAAAIQHAGNSNYSVTVHTLKTKAATIVYLKGKPVTI